MTTVQLLQQLRAQLEDLHYRERRALVWQNRDEQNALYASGALAVIHAQIGELTYLVEQIEREGIKDDLRFQPDLPQGILTTA
ncbi:MAG: hypothetical protein KF832_06060 [Caldilineaceae bacterium]|nr:hypothetical protein [Caldilineaceae bacterium]